MRLLAILAFLMAFCWLRTSDTRLDALNGDTAYYVHASQTLRESFVLRNADTGLALDYDILGPPHAPLTTFPPLYPIVLALMGGGIDAARRFNALGLWAALVLGWMLLQRYGVPLSLRIGTGLAFLFFTNDWSRLYGSAMSETLFIPLFLAWLLVMPYVEEDWGIVTYGLLGGALALTRYIGVPFVVLGAVWVLYRRGVMASLSYSALPGIALTACLVRNYYLVGKLTGHTRPGTYSWLSVYFLASVITYWALLVVVCSSLAACLWACWRWWSSRMRPSSLPVDS